MNIYIPIIVFIIRTHLPVLSFVILLATFFLPIIRALLDFYYI